MLLNRGSSIFILPNTINCPLSPAIFQALLRGDIFGRGPLFNLEKTMVAVLHEELEYKVEKLMNKKVGGHAAEDQNQPKLPVGK